LKFDDIADLVPSIERFYDTQIDEMVLDLRYNPGGYVNTCKYLSNSIVNEKGYNGIFQQCTYNDILTADYEKSTGSGISVNRFSIPNNGHNVLGSPMYGLNLKRVFILTSKNSASASEAAIISLRPYMEVIIIGEQTYGKGVGSWTIRDTKYKYQLQPITMRYHNALMETTPDDGIAVDYFIPDGYSTLKNELGDVNEPLLAKALDLISEGQTSNVYDQDVEEKTYNLKKKGLSSLFNANILQEEQLYE
jgi:C-terminal processing protease CtpA/Prc